MIAVNILAGIIADARISLSSLAISQDSTTFTATATSNRDLSTGWFVLGILVFEEGADPGDPVTTGTGFVEIVSGAASSQSITIAKADYAMGASSFANIRIGYCPDTVFNPATVVWSTTAILPIVQSASISGTATDGQTLTAGHGNIIGSYPMTPSYVWRQCDSGGASCANEGGVASTLLLDAGNIGSTERVVVNGQNSAGTGSATSSATSVVAAAGPPLANLQAWYKFNTGITGSPVSAWADQSGNGRDLTAAGGARPSVSGGVITFDGIANIMKVSGFVKVQPVTIYFRIRQIAWAGGFTTISSDGVSSSSFQLFQLGSTPEVRIYAGTISTGNLNLLVDGNFHSMAMVFNGASSVIEIDGAAAVVSDAGPNGGDGLSIGAAAGVSNFANVAFKEILFYDVAHNQATRDAIIAYLDAI